MPARSRLTSSSSCSRVSTFKSSSISSLLVRGRLVPSSPKRKEHHDECGEAQCTSNRMQSPPPRQELDGSLRARIEGRIEQPLVGGEDHHQRERYDRSK